MRRSLLVLLLPAAATIGARSASAQDRGDIVITAARLPGGADAARLAVATQTLTAEDLRRRGEADLLDHLDGDLAGVSFDQAQDNSFQPDLFYRGYEASPLGGDAQGLAVYLDGARFNQPFGDTVDWDLIPDIAIRRVTLESANPAFGLNALGGAVAIDLKSGRDLAGVTATASLGSFGRRSAAAEAGTKTGAWSFYLAGQIRHDDGWRDFSPSTLHQAYADIGLDRAWGSVDLKLVGAATDLTGNGTAPVELLAARRESVFTYPDASRNRYARAQLAAKIALGRLTLQPSVYFAGYRQQTANGDLSDAGPCDDDRLTLCLDGDDGARLTDGAGAPFATLLGDGTYAQLNRSRTRTTGYGASVELSGRFGAHSVVAGAGGDGSWSRFDAQSLLGQLSSSRGFENAQGVIDMPDGPIRPVDVAVRRNDFGMFVGDIIAVDRRVDLSLSARYDLSTLGLDDRLGSALDGRHRFARLNPAMGITWRASDNVTLYTGYAETSRAPTPAELSCADPQAPCSLSAFFVGDPDLKQVVARTWEAGVRGQSARPGLSLSWRASAWRATNSDDIVFAASDTRGRAYFRNVGRTRRQGIELALGATRGRWSLGASYTLTDATYRDGFAVASPDNPAAVDGVIAVRRGDRLPGIARNIAKARIAWRIAEGATLSLDGQCQSGRWLLGDEANLTRPTRGYCVADAAASVALVRGATVFADVDNLFDRRYETFGAFTETSTVALAEAPGASNPRALSPSAPRTLRVGVRIAL
ncbi:TonB-dependent receptor [Sphingomonas sp.]|jgi:outer membrane receptor protein involved in Fe transport|uniref:TonB-dependent receptor n=1 Tax=Sphingomonas sp. TaxID=28214 RepID=UPI002E31E669|nr:TonB-dependent receptor [Sphingomonas sp.]HEX4695423.1 TonB-dependent receptor [Sphingomonas sp.]